MRNPQKLKDYMETSCATAAVPASAFRFYDEHLADGSPPVTSEFTVCRDTFGGLEQHVQCAAYPTVRAVLEPSLCFDVPIIHATQEAVPGAYSIPAQRCIELQKCMQTFDNRKLSM